MSKRLLDPMQIHTAYVLNVGADSYALLSGLRDGMAQYSFTAYNEQYQQGLDLEFQIACPNNSKPDDEYLMPLTLTEFLTDAKRIRCSCSYKDIDIPVAECELREC